MTNMDVIVLLASTVLFSWTQYVLATPQGAPKTACNSMYPQHPGPNGPVSAQSGLVQPFQILIARDQMDASRYKIRVMRNPNFQGAPNLIGFFLQVRDVNGDRPLGEFVQIPPYARSGDCDTVASTLTHVDNSPKMIDQGLEFTWVPTNLPANTENVQVLGTFVQNLQTFWVKTPSQILSMSSHSTIPSNPANAAGHPGDHQDQQPMGSANDRRPDDSVQQSTIKVTGHGGGAGGGAGSVFSFVGVIASIFLALTMAVVIN